MDAVDGSVMGHLLHAADGVAVAESGAAIPALFVVLGSRTNLCPLFQGATGSAAGGTQIANMTSLEMQIFDQRSTAVGPGTFPVPAPNATSQGTLEADVAFSITDSTCTTTTSAWATGGTVTITSLQPSVTGTYDLQYGSDHVSGTFNVNYCDGVHVQGNGGSAPSVCEP